MPFHSRSQNRAAEPERSPFMRRLGSQITVDLENSRKSPASRRRSSLNARLRRVKRAAPQLQRQTSAHAQQIPPAHGNVDLGRKALAALAASWRMKDFLRRKEEIEAFARGPPESAGGEKIIGIERPDQKLTNLKAIRRRRRRKIGWRWRRLPTARSRTWRRQRRRGSLPRKQGGQLLIHPLL